MSAKYGQHFLTNAHAADRIVEALALSPAESVLEIGPGKGALTQRLLARGAKVVCVEVDPAMVTVLQGRFGTDARLTVVPADILSFDLDAAAESDLKIVGNLPYNLTSPILRRFSEWKRWSTAVVMVQKEVGDRLAAAVGTPAYGALTVGVRLTSTVEKVFDLSETSFSPPPKVRSSVLKLARRAEPLSSDVALSTRVIQAAFQQRRKTLLNALSHGLGLEKNATTDLIRAAGLDETLRAERIDVAGFVRLTDALAARRR